jgi:deoxyribodipyrimidine photo-lyase
MPSTVILWFRRDLRLDDNPALEAALDDCACLVPLYVYDPGAEAPWMPGAASRWWLHGSLERLDTTLQCLGSRLLIRRGDTLEALCEVIASTGATRVHWNRLYDPATRTRDTDIKQRLRERGIQVASHPGSVLAEPWEITTGKGEPYRVFTPFWRRYTDRLSTIAAIPAPTALPGRPPDGDGLGVADLGLLPRIAWDGGLADTWTPGEEAAMARARAFVRDGVATYAEARDVPSRPGTSALSPHLHFGEISPRRLLTLLGHHASDAEGPAETFVRELGWREFAHHLIYHFPHTTDEPLDPRFAALPWREDQATALLEAWQRGQTGIPLVDAGMRQLWHTGWMHNRVRMVVASFLTKNLRRPWQQGARWFWDTLVDADLAANSLGWQWSAGCGADAAPYFRIFNPVLQGERFDPAGTYVRHWCPELAALPNTAIHRPWTAPEALLTRAGIRLGRDYPRPIVDLSQSRQEALAAYEVVKAQRR